MSADARLSVGANRVARWSATVGVVAWLAHVVVTRPNPFDTAWAGAILLFAALILLPLSMALLEDREEEPTWYGAVLAWSQCPAALLLLASFWREPGVAAAWLSAPWAIWTASVACLGLWRLAGRRPLVHPMSCLDVATAYLAVGGGWTLLSRAGATPLGFKPIIVLLTGIHFHYAGFVLPLVCGLAAARRFDRFSRLTCGLVVASVPLTAAGITATQLGLPQVLEAVCASSMTLGGVMAAGLQWGAFGNARPWPRALARFSSAALLFAMAFAALYAVRFLGATPWLDIPWMRVLHGTTNAFGFALPALLARSALICKKNRPILLT